MITAIKKWLAPPVFEGDEEKTGHASLLNASVLGIMLLPTLVIIVNLVARQIPTNTLLVDAVAIIVGLLFRHLLYRGKVTFVGISLTAFGFVFITAAIVSLGTIRTPTTTIYLFLVILAGALFELRGIIVSTIASSLAILGLILAENAGMLPRPDYTVTITQWITYTGLFAVIGGVAFLGNQATRKALARAEKEIAERMQAEGKLRQQNEYFSVLHQITLDLLNRQETQLLLNNIAQYAMSLVNAQHGFIFLPQGNSFLLSAATKNFAHNIGESEPQPGSGVLRQVWQTKESFIVENYSEWELRDPKYNNEGLRAIAGVPIKIGDNIIGVLEVANTKTPRTFHHEELQILNSFATLAALVLNNAQLLDFSKREITERKQAEASLQKAYEQLQINLTEIEKLQEELREQTLRDPLTGLYNRRYMEEAFKREFARSAREEHNLSIIMLDLDNLKMLNDTYGHHIGDRAIQMLAAQLKNMIREEDVVCRYGGDEFIILMDKATVEEAAKRIEEWRTALDHHPMQVDGGSTIQVSFTAGIASFPAREVSWKDVINSADIALYRAKARGRNCTVIFE